MDSRHRFKRALAFALLVAALGVLIFTAYRYVQLQQAYRIAEDVYAQMRDQVVGSGSDAAGGGTDAVARTVDFDALTRIDPNAIAWLYGPGTPIDYPVMQAFDYAFYLTHLPDGTYNASGSLFLDYNNAPDFSDRLSVIYGHNMNNGSMFGSLPSYKQQAYFDEHPTMFLTTPQRDYRIDLLYGSVVGAGMWRDRAFMYETNLEALLAFASASTTFRSDVTYTDTDRFIVLSTCSYEFDDARYLVIGVLRTL